MDFQSINQGVAVYNMVRLGLRPASLALAAALCLSSTAHAAESTFVAQASLSLTGLSFQLIDVNPTDGIAPSISFESTGYLGGEWVYDELADTYTHQGGIQYSNSLLPSAPQSYVSADGLSTINTTSNSVLMQNQVSGSDLYGALAQLNAGDPYSYSYYTSSYGSQLEVGHTSERAYESFTLSAGTGLIVRGTFSSKLSFADNSALQPELEANGYEDVSLVQYFDTTVEFTMAALDRRIYDSADAVEDVKQGNYFYRHISDSLSQGSLSGLAALDRTTSNDFEFTIVNFGSADMNGVVSLNMSADSKLELSGYRPNIDIPAIPEPSTYALMGLGLVGIMGVTRRRRRAA